MQFPACEYSRADEESTQHWTPGAGQRADCNGRGRNEAERRPPCCTLDVGCFDETETCGNDGGTRTRDEPAEDTTDEQRAKRSANDGACEATKASRHDEEQERSHLSRPFDA